MDLLKYVAREKVISGLEFGTEFSRKQIVIMQQYISDGGVIIEIPSCLNKIIERWKNSSINNMKNIALTICSFLNYTRTETIKGENNIYEELKTKGLFGINYYHAANFLNYLITVRKIKYTTVKQYEKRLAQFFEFLLRNKIVNKNDIMVHDENLSEQSFNLGYYGVYYPDKKNVKATKLVNMDEYLWQLFLKVAEKNTPEIVFGIAMQMFGGLRRGELVNLTIDDIKIPRTRERSQINLRIQDNFSLLFQNRPDVDISKCQVKRQRNQVVYNFNKHLYGYLEAHLQLRDNILKNKKETTNALFVNSNGLPMSGAEYEKRWGKAKKEFMELLKQESYASYEELKHYTWGNHIGRGIFTNLCMVYEFASSARELANLRGDHHTESSKVYVDEFAQRNKINLVLKKLDERMED